MVLALNITVDDESLQKFTKKAVKELPLSMDLFTHNFAVISKNSIKRQFLVQQKQAPRNHTASKFATRKVRRFHWEVSIPLKAHYLDTMRPHYVSLKPGRQITKWARRHYKPSHIKRGRSRVYRTSTGGIKKGSFLYVTKDPFVAKGFRRAQARLPTMLKKAVETSLGV